MGDISISDGVVPFAEFRSNISKFIREIGVSNEPLIITQNGQTAAVLISPAAFELLCERLDVLEAVVAGLSDSEAGRVVDHDKVKRWLESWGSDRERESPN